MAILGQQEVASVGGMNCDSCGKWIREGGMVLAHSDTETGEKLRGCRFECAVQLQAQLERKRESRKTNGGTKMTEDTSESEFMREEQRGDELDFEDIPPDEPPTKARSAVAVVEDTPPKAVIRAPAAPMSVWDMPAEQFGAALENRKQTRSQLIKWVRDHLIPSDKDKGIAGDYNVLQGRKSLAKPGAEKILSLLALSASYPNAPEYERAALEGREITTIILNCKLHKADGGFVAEGMGARTIAKDKGDINKAIKMAKKSALIDAVLALGLSEIFTQDLEDAKNGSSNSAPKKKSAPPPAAPPPPKPESAKGLDAVKQWLSFNNVDMPRDKKMQHEWVTAAAQALSPEFAASAGKNTTEDALVVLAVLWDKQGEKVLKALTEAAEFVGVIRQPGADENEEAA